MIRQYEFPMMVLLLFFAAFCLLPQANPLLEQDLQILSKLKQGRPQVTKGIERFHSGDLKAARQILETCVAALPQTYEACFILAQIRYHDNDFAGALDWIKKADAGYMQVQEILARVSQNQVLLDANKRDELNDMALDLQKQSSRAQCSQEKLRLVSSQLDQKAKELHGEQNDMQLAEMNIPPDYAYMQGNILFRLKRLDEAETWYKNAIRLDPQHVASYNNLINLCLMSHRLAEARQWLGEAEKKKLKVSQALVDAVRQAR
jgi:tetratricopeptide (TPR) repeat protein